MAGVWQRLDVAILGGVALVIVGAIGQPVRSISIALDGIKIEMAELKQAVRDVVVHAGLAGGTGVAHPANVDLGPRAGHAAGIGTAHDATVETHEPGG